jgi:DNA recombination-dependent growth factor C
LDAYYPKMKNLDKEEIRKLRRTWRNSLKSQIICELDNL